MAEALDDLPFDSGSKLWQSDLPTTQQRLLLDQHAYGLPPFDALATSGNYSERTEHDEHGGDRVRHGPGDEEKSMAEQRRRRKRGCLEGLCPTWPHTE